MGQGDTAFFEYRCKSKRAPVFVFVFDEVLFKFAVNRPHFEPLFQLPPRLNTRCSCSPIIENSLINLPYVGDTSPTPPQEGI